MNWDRYRGNNHHIIAPSEILRGGSVNLGDHLGKPLSQRLYEDLFERLDISGLCIYNHDAAAWLLGWGAGHCTIWLNADETVRSIDIVPYFRPDRSRPTGPRHYEEKIGGAVGNLSAIAKADFG